MVGQKKIFMGLIMVDFFSRKGTALYPSSICDEYYSMYLGTRRYEIKAPVRCTIKFITGKIKVKPFTRFVPRKEPMRHSRQLLGALPAFLMLSQGAFALVGPRETRMDGAKKQPEPVLEPESI